MSFKNTIPICILTLLSVSLFNCSKRLDILEYISSDKPINITIGNNDRKDSLRFFNVKKMELKKDTDKFNQLKSWGQTNTKEWKWTPATYVAADIYLTVDEFHLLYYKNGSVVVDFKDKEGKYRQFYKEIKPGELDFLSN